MDNKINNRNMNLTSTKALIKTMKKMSSTSQIKNNNRNNLKTKDTYLR